MYTGGYVNEFEVIMATNNGDIGEVKWTTMLYWILMLLLAIGSIKAQLDDRKLHLEAYQYKYHNGGQHLESYRTMRERITRFGAGGQGAYDSADHSAQLDDEEEEQFFKNDHGH